MDKIENPKRTIIIGAGDSMKEGISKGLWDKLKGEFTIGCNFCFHHFDPTILCFVDKSFYNKNQNEIDKLPLTVCRSKMGIVDSPTRFSFVCSAGEYYGKKSFKIDRVYSAVLVGLFATTLAVCLGIKEVYLLGFDWTKKSYSKDKKNRPRTHYYQENGKTPEHKGIGRTNYYDGHDPNKDFGVYLQEKDISFYNVSIISNITCFPKITYDEFFKRLEVNPPNYKQEQLREDMKCLIRGFRT